MQTEPNTPLKLEPEKETIGRTGLCRTLIHKLVEAGSFPQPVYVGTRKKMFPSCEVDAWIMAKMNERAEGRQRAKEAAAKVQRARATTLEERRAAA